MWFRNPNFVQLKTNYLFAEIAKRKKAFPAEDLINLGVGDTTCPIPRQIAQALQRKIEELTSLETYEGYGPEAGDPELRELIASTLYPRNISSNEIYISDGSKPDIARLQWLFSSEATVAVQTPSYPVYALDSIISGRSSLTYLPCIPENNFFPSLEEATHVDILYFCNPNNPTSAAATKEQLTTLVRFAEENDTLIIYDAAYAAYIQDPSLPKSIYEIPGAEKVAIESGSFSKTIGFTGVRLGWTVVPHTLSFNDGTLLYQDWEQILSTTFNGASIISQAGGKAALSPEGLKETEKLVQYYLKNAQLLKKIFNEKGYRTYGGKNAPYIWVDLAGEKSWDAFNRLLNEQHIVTVPGAGFGDAGENFLRLSAYADRESILRLQAICPNSNKALKAV